MAEENEAEANAGNPPAMPGDLAAAAAEIREQQPGKKKRDRSTGRPRGRPPKASTSPGLDMPPEKREAIRARLKAERDQFREPPPPPPPAVRVPTPENMVHACQKVLEKLAQFSGTTPPQDGDAYECAMALQPIAAHLSTSLEKTGPYGNAIIFSLLYFGPRAIELAQKRTAAARARRVAAAEEAERRAAAAEAERIRNNGGAPPAAGAAAFGALVEV